MSANTCIGRWYIFVLVFIHFIYFRILLFMAGEGVVSLAVVISF